VILMPTTASASMTRVTAVPAPALVDQPEVTQGTWVRPGGVVVERAFAEALGVRVGDRLRAVPGSARSCSSSRS
jgi:predicted lysophospholipase L1 biosynthesis ABC-type transport system permease subunit